MRGRQVGGLDTKHMLYRGSARVQSSRQRERWPTSGWMGYTTYGIWMVPNASQHWTKSEMAHKWADWLHNPCRLRGPQHCTEGAKINSGSQNGGLAT